MKLIIPTTHTAVREHTIPAYKTAQMAGRRSGKHMHITHNPCLQDRTDGRSPIRETHTHTIPAYKTAQMAGRRSGNTRIHTQSLPTRPHIWQVAGQGNTHKHIIPAYKTTQMAGRRSGKHMHTHNPCLQDHTDGRSSVREHTLYNPCLQDRTDGRSPVRETHAYTQSLPTRPHRWQVAGRGDTHNPCRTDGRQLQLVRDCTELDIKYLGLSSYV